MTTILILCVIGILAVLAELVLPGGILGVIGALCLVGAVVATYVGYGAVAGTIALVSLVALSLVTLGYWMKWFHRLPVTRDMVLGETVGKDSKTTERNLLTGRRGTALTDLMPSGRAEIEGARHDVLAEGASIAKGAKLVVVGTRGPSVLVREED